MTPPTECRRDEDLALPSKRKSFNFKGSNGKTWFLGKICKNKGFPGKNRVFHLHPLFWHFSQAKCRMFEEQSKGAGSRAGVERSRQVSFTAKLYIGVLDVFWESLVVSFCIAKCAMAPCSSSWSSKGRGGREGVVSQHSRMKRDNQLECTSVQFTTCSSMVLLLHF